MEQTTNDWRRHFDPEMVERLQALRLPSPRRSEGRMAGHRRNPRIGGSADFAQHRQYVPGDDLRLVDWKVFGRTDRYFLKQREDESNLVCHLIIDASGSMTYRSESASMDKLEFARRWAAALAFVALQHRDSITLSSFDTQARTLLSAAGSGTGWIRVVAEALDRIQPGGDTNLPAVLNHVANRLTRRGLIVLVSDLLDDPAAVAASLRGLASRGHRLMVVQVLDPDEVNPPWDYPVRLIGLEGESAIETDPNAIRRAYREARLSLTQMLETVCRETNTAWLSVPTDAPLSVAVEELLSVR